MNIPRSTTTKTTTQTPTIIIIRTNRHIIRVHSVESVFRILFHSVLFCLP